MSTIELNLEFAPVAEQKPAKISLHRQRFLLRRARLQRKAYLKKKMAGAPAQEGRPHPMGPPSQGPLCFSNGLPVGRGSHQASNGSHQGGRGSHQGSKGSHQASRGSHQGGCQDSKAWTFTPSSSSSAPPQPAAPPPADALLLSECQSALPPLGAGPPRRRHRPAKGGPPPCPSSEGKPAPLKPYKCVALDCEMVGTKDAGKRSEVARCSIVSYHGDLIYDKYILPLNPITDYRTRWSGIRRCHMKNATPFKLARREILKILSGKVVIGHAIDNDFKALKYMHPQSMTRDTSRMPALNKKAGFSEKETVSLKRLTKALFDKDIQVGKKGHSSVEDARATMDLFRLAEEQLELEQVADSAQK